MKPSHRFLTAILTLSLCSAGPLLGAEMIRLDAKPGGAKVRIEGTSCACERTSFRMRVLGRRDDMFIVRGVNVYPAAILSVVGEFRPRVTGRGPTRRS